MGDHGGEQDGLPYLIIIITLVLCSLLLATIALIIVIVVIRQKRRKSRSDSLQEEAIAYEDMDKPATRAMEVQPDLRSLEPRGDPRAFMPFAPIPTRRYTSLPFESQRRLIPVPEEEGSADERLTSPEELFNFPVYALQAEAEEGYADGEGEGEGGDYPAAPLRPHSPPVAAAASGCREKT
ncbi:uncharacterized protein LOC143289447 isoform X2 [Babylonia areolata]|uniref:uncharacterized protein LOC143289447 isoform X2 n=1 Tax=Babylonia areolata TaxID=304850 RepID=UPI003FD68ED3